MSFQELRSTYSSSPLLSHYTAYLNYSAVSLSIFGILRSCGRESSPRISHIDVESAVQIIERGDGRVIARHVIDLGVWSERRDKPLRMTLLPRCRGLPSLFRGAYEQVRYLAVRQLRSPRLPQYLGRLLDYVERLLSLCLRHKMSLATYAVEQHGVRRQPEAMTGRSVIYRIAQDRSRRGVQGHRDLLKVMRLWHALVTLRTQTPMSLLDSSIGQYSLF